MTWRVWICSERKAYWPFFLTDFCPRSADVTPITKIHFVRKARERLWINGQGPSKNAPWDEAWRIAADIVKLPEMVR